MTQKKITKRESFTEIKEILESLGKDSLVEVMEHELELLAKKNASAKDKPTATQVANEGIKETIIDTLLENGDKMTISEMQKANAELGELSNQRISALIRQLISDGRVERVEEKRKAYFKAV
jgi:carbamoylphosphate synthase small subunit